MMKICALLLLVSLAAAQDDYDYGNDDSDDYDGDYGDGDYEGFGEAEPAPGAMSPGWYDSAYDDTYAPGADPFGGPGALPPSYDDLDLDLGLPPLGYDDVAPGRDIYPNVGGPFGNYGPLPADPLLDYNLNLNLPSAYSAPAYGPMLPGVLDAPAPRTEKQKKVLKSLSHLLQTLAEAKKKK